MRVKKGRTDISLKDFIIMGFSFSHNLILSVKKKVTPGAKDKEAHTAGITVNCACRHSFSMTTQIYMQVLVM